MLNRVCFKHNTLNLALNFCWEEYSFVAMYQCLNNTMVVILFSEAINIPHGDIRRIVQKCQIGRNLSTLFQRRKNPLLIVLFS